MRSFEVAFFCVIIGCLVKLNEPRKISNSDQNAVQEEIPPIAKLSTLDNSDSKGPAKRDASCRDKLNQEPSQVSSRVRRDESEIDYSECGINTDNPKSELESGYVADVWPWMVALLHIKRSPSDEKIICGGSIINKQFIMTSAICVTSRGMAMKPDEISVVLGLAHRRGGDQSQQFDIRAVYVHPEFNATNYDYDVALLELKEPIVYNPYIRPICLPTTNSSFYRPQSLGLGLGWGTKRTEYASTLQRKTLKEVELVIQDPDACKENLGVKFERYFTDRTFCAVEESPYLCDGDGGGPVMQSEVREDGYRIWSQVGIVSFGIGCGPENPVGFYSYVYKFLPWIRDVAYRFE